MNRQDHPHVDGPCPVPVLTQTSRLNRDAVCRPWPDCTRHPQGFAPGVIHAGDGRLMPEYETGPQLRYTLACDTGETADLSETEPEKTAELLVKLTAWRNDIGAELIRPNRGFAGTTP